MSVFAYDQFNTPVNGPVRRTVIAFLIVDGGLNAVSRFALKKRTSYLFLSFLKEDGFIYQVDSETGVPYFLSPTLLPPGVLQADVSQELLEPQTSLPSAPSHPDDDLVPRSPCVPPFTIPDFPLPWGPPLESRRTPIYEKITPLVMQGEEGRWLFLFILVINLDFDFDSLNQDLLGKVGLHCYNLQNVNLSLSLDCLLYYWFL